jgi:hypothetical protein
MGEILGSYHKNLSSTTFYNSLSRIQQQQQQQQQQQHHQ